MKKKFVAKMCIGLALVVGSMSLFGCGKEKVSVSKEVVEIKDANISLSSDVYRYYVFEKASRYVYSENTSFDGDFSNYDWNKDVNGEKLCDVVKKDAFRAMVGMALTLEYAKNNGLEIGEDEMNNVKEQIKNYKTQAGEDMFIKTLNTLGMKTEEGYLKLYELQTGYSKILEDFKTNKDRYIKPDVNYEQYKNDDTVTAKHILIKNDSEKFSDPKATAEEVLGKIKNGGDFDALMQEYNEDTGETTDGYTFSHGEMVPEFENGAIALNIGDVSDVVETSYGYHIITRMIGLGEVINYIFETEKVKLDENKFTKDVDVAEIMNMSSEATKFMTEAQKQAQQAQAAEQPAEAK